MKCYILLLCYLCLVSGQQERRRRIKKKIIVPSDETIKETTDAVVEEIQINEEDQKQKAPRG